MSRKFDATEKLGELWFETKKDENYIWVYIDEFLLLYAACIDKDLTLYKQGFNAEGPHLSVLPENFLTTLNRKIFETFKSPEKKNLNKVGQIVKCLIILCRNFDNIPFIASCDFVSQIIIITSAYLKKLNEFNTDNGSSDDAEFLHTVLYFFECMYDPYFTWRNRMLCRKTDLSKATFKPSLLHVEIVPFFYDWFHQETLEHIPRDASLRIIHVFGAIMSGAQHNALMAISPATLEVLTKVVIDGNLTNEIKKAALKCVVHMIHTLHMSSPDQRQVEVSTVIDAYIKTLGRLCISPDADEHMSIITSMTDMFQDMLECKDRSSLQVILAGSGCCDYLVQLLDRIQLQYCNAQVFAASVINAIKIIIARSTKAKKIFTEEAGYGTLLMLLQRLGQPSKELLQSLLHLCTEQIGPKTSVIVKNAEAAQLLLQWLPVINCDELQEWLAEMLLVTCGHSIHSRAKCCEVSMIGSIVTVLQQESVISTKAIGLLLRLLEKLGSHSITAYELKQIIRIMRPDAENRLFPYTSSLMHTISTMARNDGYNGALHYFDFQGPNDGISVSGIRKWPGNSYTFHAWVRLDMKTVSSVGNSGFIGGYRRQLYSFYNGSGTGFEAFFTTENVLMIAVCTRKDYHCFGLTKHPFVDNQWHCIDICHGPSRRPFVQSQIQVYIDGHLKDSEHLKFPSFTETFTQCRIASAGLRSNMLQSINIRDDSDTKSNTLERSWPFHLSFSLPAPIRTSVLLSTGVADSSVLTVSAGTQDEIWGRPYSLQGQLGTICILHETLTAAQVKSIYSQGPNSSTIFRTESGDFNDLGSKLVLYYDPKACEESVCIDLSPARLYDGHGVGQKCVTYDIKDIINCIGGLQVLFPLLEYAGRSSSCQKMVDFTTVVTPSPINHEDDEGGENSEDWEVLPSSSVSDSKLEQNLVAGFMVLLRTLIQNSRVNHDQMLEKRAVATIGALLQKIPSSCVDVNLLMSVQLLIECVSNMSTSSSYQLANNSAKPETVSLLHALYHYIVFDFRIWSRSAFPVKIGHIQYLSTIIKDNKKFFRKKYGVQFMLDILRTFYSNDSYCCNDDLKTIRSSILGLIKYYVCRDISFKELSAIVAFITSVRDDNTLIDVFELLFALTDNEHARSDQIFLLLFEPNAAEYFYVLLISDNHSDHLKVTVLKLITTLLKTTKVYDKSKLRLKLHDIGYCGLTSLLQNLSVTSEMTLLMLDQALLTDDSGSFLGIMSLLHFLENMDLKVKLEAAQKIHASVMSKSSVPSIIAKLPAWEDSILRLLIKRQLDSNNLSQLSTKDIFDDHCDSTDRVCIADETNENTKAIDIPRVCYREGESKKGLDSPAVAQSPLFQSSIFSFDAHKYSFRSYSDSQFSSNDDISVQSSFSTSLQESCADDNVRQGDDPTLKIDDGMSSASSTSHVLSAADQMVHSSQTSLASLHSSSSGIESAFIIHNAEKNVNVQHEDDKIANAVSTSNDCNTLPEVNLVDCVLDIMFAVVWKGIEGSNNESWKSRGRLLACINMIALSNELYQSHLIIKRRLFEMCLQACISDLKNAECQNRKRDDQKPTNCGQANASHAENAIQLMKFIHDFIFSDGYEDNRKLSIKLLDGIVEILDTLLVFEEAPGEEEWTEMATIGMTILLISAANDKLELCSFSTARLHALIQTRPLNDLNEACYILSMLNTAVIRAAEGNNPDHYSFLMPVIKALLEKVGSRLYIQRYLPSLPSTLSGPAFFEKFYQYSKEDDWTHFINKIIRPQREKFIQQNLLPSREEKNMFWNECFEAIMLGAHTRNREIGESKLKFLSQIVEPFHKLATDEENRYQNVIQLGKQQNVLTRRRWMASRHFLFSPRGAWESRTSVGPYWKLSHHENFNRMRLKLTINHNFDDQIKASRLRDNFGPIENTSVEGFPPLNVAKEAVVSELHDDSVTDDEVTALTSEQLEAPEITGKEKLILSEKCELVTLMSVVEGTIEITTNNVYFFDRSPVKEDGDRLDFKWPIIMLREVHLRRYNLRRSALEFFLIDQTNYFINFIAKMRNKVYSRIIALRPPNLFYYGSRGPAELLKASGLTQKWVQHEISNFEYLIQLNTIAGRTYNDLSQYPVFPWILADYSSPELDLDKESTFRDLSRPIGVANPKNIAEVKAKYEQFEDVTGMIEKFHFGTHYSNSAGVLHYLVRTEPFTSLHIDLQAGRFDVADRQFHSLDATWNMLMENPNDVKELIPEFFYFPEFLINANGFDLGKLQSSNQVVGDVVLPPWAASADDFIYQHRNALESEYISNHLHEWIDLIFGYKQKGPDAVEALNVFYYCSYEGAVDLDAITDPVVREATEGMINNFGQTPCQLLKELHPKRMSKEDAYKKMLKSETKRPNILLFPDQLKAFFIELCASNTYAVYISLPKNQSRSFIQHGMPDNLVTVSETGVVGVHGWLPYDKSISNYFTFEKDPTLSNNKTTRKISGPFQPGIEIIHKLFVVTHDAKLLISAGHWDNSIRVYHLSKNRTVAHIIKHTDVVTCLSLDACGNHLISGSRDTTSKIWEIRQNTSSSHVLNQKPLLTLYGHNDEVTCVSIAIELDMAVSGSKDGTVNVYTVRDGQYLRTLRPSGADDILELYNIAQTVTQLTLSDQGHICLHCCDVNSSLDSSNSLHIYSINGCHLAQEVLVDSITSMVTSKDYLITGSTNGVLRITEIHGLRLMSCMSLHIPITCVSLTSGNTHILVTLKDGKLIVVGLEKPSEPK